VQQILAAFLIAFGSATLTWFLMRQAQRADLMTLQLRHDQQQRRLKRRCELLQGRIERVQLETRLEVLKELARFLVDSADLRGGPPMMLREFERRLIEPGR
jgi:hypothetical protein